MSEEEEDVGQKIKYTLEDPLILGQTHYRSKASYLGVKQQDMLAILLTTGAVSKKIFQGKFKNMDYYYQFTFDIMPMGAYIHEEGASLYLAGEIDVSLLLPKNNYRYTKKLIKVLKLNGVNVNAAMEGEPGYPRANSQGGKSIRCSINGNQFESMVAAAKAAGVTSKTVKNRCASFDWPNYKFE